MDRVCFVSVTVAVETERDDAAPVDSGCRQTYGVLFPGKMRLTGSQFVRAYPEPGQMLAEKGLAAQQPPKRSPLAGGHKAAQ